VKHFIEMVKADFLESSVLEKLTLEELLEYQRKKKFPSPNILHCAIVSRAAAEGDEETALASLSSVGPHLKSRAVAAIFDIYVNSIGDGFKALEYLDVIMQDARVRNEVAIPLPTMFRLVEILLQNGRTLGDLQLFDEISQAEIQLSFPYGSLDRRFLSRMVAWIGAWWPITWPSFRI